MSRQNLEREAVYSLLREWDGKYTTPEMLDRMLEHGHYAVADIRQWQEDRLGDDLRGFKARCRKNRETREQWLNFTEQDVEGQAVHYWKKFRSLTVDEHVQLWRYWAGKVEQDSVHFYEYFDAAPEAKRRRALEEFGAYNLPPRPRQQGLPGMDGDDEG